MYDSLFNSIQENFRAALSIYFDWYTFFWTLNLAALAWIYAKSQDLPLPVLKNRRAIAVMFAILSILGACSSLMMIPFTREMNAKSQLAQKLWSESSSSQPGYEMIAKLSDLPSFMTNYAYVANASSTLLIGVFWILMFVRDRRTA